MAGHGRIMLQSAAEFAAPGFEFFLQNHLRIWFPGKQAVELIRFIGES